MAVPHLADFYLVGGTALSLYYGHRLSIDLDLFSTNDFEPSELAVALEGSFPTFSYNVVEKVGVFGFIDDVKVDFVKHHYFNLIADTSFQDGIRLYSRPDIAAMKVAAILKRGVKKDFWDMAELLHEYSIKEIVGFYSLKYPSQQLLISIPQALVYFDDAEDSEEPVSLKGQTWNGVKEVIQSKVQEYLR
jgi:hypothetical protein